MPKPELTKKIYGLASVCDMIEQGSHEDDLHFLVHRVTGKCRIKDLTDDEADKVIKELKEFIKLTDLEKRAPPPRADALISEAQIKLAFRKMYELAALDEAPPESTVRERLTGVICKVTGKSVNSSDNIFKGLTEAQGAAVIEELKRYIRTARKRRKRKGE